MKSNESARKSARKRCGSEVPRTSRRVRELVRGWREQAEPRTPKRNLGDRLHRGEASYSAVFST
eukprot:5197195-Pyramimonas_sp.AAC.4